jgi:hypothetical protein
MVESPRYVPNSRVTNLNTDILSAEDDSNGAEGTILHARDTFPVVGDDFGTRSFLLLKTSSKLEISSAAYRWAAIHEGRFYLRTGHSPSPNPHGSELLHLLNT